MFWNGNITADAERIIHGSDYLYIHIIRVASTSHIVGKHFIVTIRWTDWLIGVNSIWDDTISTAINLHKSLTTLSILASRCLSVAVFSGLDSISTTVFLFLPTPLTWTETKLLYSFIFGFKPWFLLYMAPPIFSSRSFFLLNYHTRRCANWRRGSFQKKYIFGVFKITSFGGI